MPLFGLFNSKKDKKSANGISTSTNGRSNASAASAQDDESMWESISPTTQSHIHGDDTPSEPAPTSSRMKMPFQRRKASVSAVTSLPQTSPSRPQRAPNPYMSSSSADVTGQLRPPIKSAIFSSYGETSGSSTRSLPSTTRTAPDTFSYQDMIDDTSRMPSQPKKKSGGLLTWARERTKSKPSSPPVIPAEAFNLRTFRHVRPGSPLQSERPSVDLSLEPPPARPRPRGDSAVSDSSQRISVAAFREAQARRSTANSPVPSFRPPSSTDTLTTRALTPTRSVPQIDKTRTHAAARRSIVPDSSSSSASSEEEESDDDAPPNSHLGRRKRTITKRPYARAQTDIGHGQQHSESQNEPARRSMVAIQPSPTAQMVGSSRAPSSMGAYGKSRGSVSTSALDSNRRSSVDFPARKVPSKQMHSSDSSSSDSDSDDAPLASLVGPRRPGSAMSGASNPRSRAPSKPLIDIKTLVTDQTVLSSSPVSATRDQEMEREDVTGLAKLAALARQAAEAEDRSQSPSPPPKVAQPQPKVALSRPVASNFSIPKHRRSSSDIVTSLSTPAAEPPYPLSRGQEAPASTYSPQPIVTTRVISPEPNEVDDDDIMPALRFMMPKTYPADGDSSAPADSSATNEARIVPTPIRQRIPLSSFSVMSRPQHRTQQSSNSILTAPSTSTSTSTSPTITPKIVSSTASTSMASLASKTTSPRPGRGRSSALTISTDPLLTSSSSTSSPSSSPTLPPSVLKRPAPTSTKPPQPASPVKSTTSTSQSESSSGLTRRSRGSTTLISQIPPSASLNPDSRPQALSSSKNLSRPDTLVSRIPTPSSIVSTAKPKPFAGSAMRRESPASSTGDSSSGRLPLTPRDGSDFGSKDNWDRMGRLSGGLQQGRDNKEHRKKRSVSFGEDFDFERGRDKGIARERERERERERAEDVETPVEGENRRRDRRRSEARAAIELGNVINGRRPTDDSEDEDNSDLVHHNLGPQFNPMLAMGAGPPGWNQWQQQGQPSPGLMPPHPNQYGQDANFLAAHQQAMMIAKQTYQMAVAQQALAAAGDEWERNSNVSGFGGNQGFAPNPGFGFGGSNMNMGMFGMGSGMGGYGSGMGMGMMPNWSSASLMAPSGPRSAYGGVFGGAQSEYGGGPSGGGGWGSRSMYGESFGPSPADRASRAFSAAPLGQSQHRQQQQTSFPPSKGSRERERRNESSGNPNRADGGSSSSGQHMRPGPRPRTLTAPSGSPHQVKMRRPQPPASPPPSSFRRFNGT